MASSDDTRFAKYISSGVISIFVGRKRKEYIIHKKLLCEKSKYFEKVLQKGFKEKEENAIYQPEETSAAFDLFVRWIYQNMLPDVLSKPPGGSRTTYLQLYVMADKFCLANLKNETMNCVVDWSTKTVFTDSDVGYVYLNTMVGSPLRRLVADVFARDIHVSQLLKPIETSSPTKESDECKRRHLLAAIRQPPDFAIDLIFAMDKMAVTYSPPNPWENKSAYHEPIQTDTPVTNS